MTNVHCQQKFLVTDELGASKTKLMQVAAKGAELREELASSGGRLEVAVAGERRCLELLRAQEEAASRLTRQIEELQAEVGYHCLPEPL